MSQQRGFIWSDMTIIEKVFVVIHGAWLISLWPVGIAWAFCQDNWVGDLLIGWLASWGLIYTGLKIVNWRA